ncbi:MAG: hypothetical protein Q9181_001899 [Wetmoreana brouardii]
MIYNGTAFAPGHALSLTATSTSSTTASTASATVMSKSGDVCLITSSEQNHTTWKIAVGVGVGRRSAAGTSSSCLGETAHGYKADNGMEGDQQNLHEMPGRLGDNGIREAAATEGWREMPGSSVVN